MTRFRVHKQFILIVALCSIWSMQSYHVNAQKGFEVGAWVGLANYFGDLNTNYRLNKPGPAFGLIGRYDMNSRMAVKFSANYGQIQAFDSDSDNTFEQARNLSFRSNVIDGTLQYEFHFFPYIHGSEEFFFTPYLFAGLTAFYFDPQAEYQGDWVRLRPLGTEGQAVGNEYSNVQMALAYGAGLKFDLNYYWSVNIELSARSLFTDYLDDVSTIYPDINALSTSRGPVAAALSDRSGEISDIQIGELGRQRGNSNDKDAYAFLSVGVVYYIPFLECPGLSRPDRQ